jgi:hypothetical protein
VEAKNPVSTYLLARYLLELAATVSWIDFELDDCMRIDFRDWKHRGITFMTLLYRARHSTSDPKTKSIFSKHGIPEKLGQPIRIGKAVKKLAARLGFSAAVSHYDTLSNICHHNGSGHKLLVESGRTTNAIVTRSGKPIFLKKKMAAVTMGYPASSFSSGALARTARVAW